VLNDPASRPVLCEATCLFMEVRSAPSLGVIGATRAVRAHAVPLRMSLAWCAALFLLHGSLSCTTAIREHLRNSFHSSI
jgi:hypothetical protein